MSDIIVNANESITRTGIIVVKKQVKKISVSGKWKDAYTECDANGWTGYDMLFSFLYENPFLDSQKKVPGMPYMKLMAKVGEIFFEIGNIKNKEIIMPDSGELCLFPNHIEWLYWNNSGNITVSII